MESGGHFRGHPLPVQGVNDLATEYFGGDSRHRIIDTGQGIFRIQTHIDTLVATCLLTHRRSRTRLVTERLAGRCPPLRTETAEIAQQCPADRRFIHVAHDQQHAVVHPGEQGLVELRRLGLRPRIQARHIFLRRIVETGIHHGVQPVVHRFLRPFRVAQVDIELAPVHGPTVCEGQQRLHQGRQLRGRRLTVDGGERQGDLRLHPDAVHGQMVPEIGCGHSAGIIQGQHIPEIAALPFRQAGDSGQTAAQQEGILEIPKTRNLLVYHPDPVGEGPQDAAGDRLGLGLLQPDPWAVHFQAGGVPLPGIILGFLERGPVQISQIVLEQGIILIQRVQAGTIFQGQVGELAQEGIRELVEQTGLRGVRNVLTGKKTRFFAIRCQIGSIKEMGHAAVYVLPVRQGFIPPGNHPGHHHFLRIGELRHRNPETIQTRQRSGNDLHRRLQMLPVRLDLHGIFLVAVGFGAIQIPEVQSSVRDVSVPQVPFDPPHGDGLELTAQDAHHEGLGRIHLLLRRTRGCIGHADDAPVSHRFVLPDDGRHYRRLPNVVRPPAVLHEMLRDHHRKDVHLLLELHRVDVTAHDDCLVSPGCCHLGESNEQGRVQDIGVIYRDMVQMQDRGSILVLEESTGTGADSMPGKIFRFQPFFCGPGRRFSPSDDGEIGITLGFVVFHQIVCHTAAQGPFLDLPVHGKGREGLRWHSS